MPVLLKLKQLSVLANKRSLRLKPLICLIILCLLSLEALASPPKPFIDSLNFPSTNGAVNNRTFTDKQGFLWLAVWGSYLNRYDGVNSSSEFQYDTDISNPMDEWGRIWYQRYKNEDTYIGYFHTKTGKEHDVQLLDQRNQPFKISDYLSLTSGQQHLWLMTKSGDLYQAPLAENLSNTIKFILLSHVDTRLYSTSVTSSPNSLTSDSAGNIWFALGSQLLRYNVLKKTWTDFSHLILPGQSIDWGVHVAITRDHVTWLTMIGINTIFRLDHQDHLITIDLPCRIHDITFDPTRNRTWISTTDGLYYADGEATTLQHMVAEPWQDAGLTTPTIRFLDLDFYGNLWFTSNRGVQVIRSLHDHVQRITPNIFRKSYQPDAALQIVLGLTCQDSQFLWWFNRRQELIRYDIHTGTETVFPIVFDNPSDEARSITFSNPLILLTTHSGELLRFDTQTLRFLAPVKLIFDNKANTNNFINSTKILNNQHWLSGFKALYTPSGTETARQFNYWDAKSQTLKRFDCTMDKPILSYYPNATKIMNASQYANTLWLTPNASIDNHLFQISLQDHKCSVLPLPFKPDFIYATLQTEPESIWLVQGTYLRKMRLTDRALLYEQALPVKAMDSVMVGQKGYILVYGDSALWRFDTVDQTWHPLFVSEITLENKSGINPYFDAPNHTFYILSHQGVLAIDIERSLVLPKPSLVFTSYKVSQHKTTLFKDENEFTIPYGEPIEINYLATPLVPSKLQRVRYRLNDAVDWTDSTNSSLVFTQLPPGKLQLEMQATTNYQDFGKSSFLRVHVLPPWWRSDLAYGGYALLSGLLILGGLNLQRTRERLRQAKLTVSLFENTSEGLCILSSSFQVLRINQSMQSMMGWLPKDNLRALLQNIQTIKGKKHVFQIMGTLPHSHRWHGEVQMTGVSGQSFLAELRIDRLPKKDPNGEFILIVEDITERKQHEQHLDYLSRHDFLTQLPNRLYFHEHLTSLIASLAPGDRYALILLDLDDFKFFNDRLGHNVGDLLLQDIATDLATEISQGNFVARHGGDEFIFIFPAPAVKSTQLKATLAQLQAKISRKRDISGHEITITSSLGVTFLPDNSHNPTLLLQQADMAMYQAKREGKEGFVYFTEKLNIEMLRGIELENAILNNIGHFGLLVHYQPKIDISKQHICGFEALSRWRLSSGEFLSPDKFLPFIRPGKMEHIFALAVLRQACQDYLSFQKFKPDIKISINVSPRHLEAASFVDIVREVLDEYKIPYQALMIEILEDAGINNKEVLDSLQKLRDYQIGISIDDFGTGYSSLSHLNKLNANELKIDRSFLQGIPHDQSAVSLFEKVVELGQKFDMSIICEGIETKEQLDYIKSCGVNYYQGYYFSPPVPAEKILTLLNNHSKLSNSA